MICKYRYTESGCVRGMERMFLYLKKCIKVVDKDLGIGAKIHTMSFFLTKSLNTKRFL